MTMLDPTTLAALRAAKEKATAGPWAVDFDKREGGCDQIIELRTGRGLTISFGTSNGNEYDFPYIVLLVNSADSLLDAAEENVRLRKALKSARTYLTDHHNMAYADGAMFDENGVCRICATEPQSIFEIIDTALERTP